MHADYVFRAVLGFGITDMGKSPNLIYLFLRQRYLSLRLGNFSLGDQKHQCSLITDFLTHQLHCQV